MRLGIYLERKPNSGGAYQYCLAILKALADMPKEKMTVTAFCTYEDWKKVTEPLGIRTETVRKNPIEKVCYYLAERLLPVKVCRKMCRILHPLARRFRKQKIDVCLYPCGDKISFMMDTPCIVTVFDLMHRYLTDFPEIADKKIYRSRERSYTNIARYALMILVDSTVGKKQMIECYDKNGALGEKIYPLPYIAPDYVYRAAAESAKRRNDIELLQKLPEKYLFYPAQLWKHKNHRNLLLALKQLKDEGIEISLVLSGADKNGSEDVVSVIEQFGLQDRVMILGYVSNEEMTVLYQNARALVMPTFGGPTNIPQLEAFVLGCPVATSRIFGIPEQVGDAALLFDPDSVDEIADCVRKLWQDDAVCRELVLKGYQRAEQWGEKQFRDRLEEILDKIILC